MYKRRNVKIKLPRHSSPPVWFILESMNLEMSHERRLDFLSEMTFFDVDGTVAPLPDAVFLDPFAFAVCDDPRMTSNFTNPDPQPKTNASAPNDYPQPLYKTYTPHNPHTSIPPNGH